jgi:hypothetical protein
VNVEDIFLLGKGLMEGGLKLLANDAFKGGLAFDAYKTARGGTATLDFIEATTKDGRLVQQRISNEFHHAFITQRFQKAHNLPDWLVNNRLNVWKMNTIQHAIIDPERFRFLRFSLKQEVGVFGKYNWFTKFPKATP